MGLFNFLSPYPLSPIYYVPITNSGLNFPYSLPSSGEERKKCDNWEWKSYFHIKSVNVKCIIYIICERILPKLWLLKTIFVISFLTN